MGQRTHGDGTSTGAGSSRLEIIQPTRSMRSSPNRRVARSDGSDPGMAPAASAVVIRPYWAGSSPIAGPSPTAQSAKTPK
ncbi:hypothetical protein [Nonomuraea sp. NPDC049309]|uniref:hypothetical protein n=1 Tax=Nonomuraea sp. NPDC049309 TaxID=3364350 RepID=UPI00371AE4E1